ncbi:MAG: glycoside hydrolase N-terminal domain-containing protein [Oscillospiraceae bacterium]|nr:glycoside hydrolase N-terminal domain-containing protein [Oscillospiraceae bacterium]
MKLTKFLASVLAAALIAGVLSAGGVSGIVSAEAEETDMRPQMGISTTYPTQYRDWVHGLFGGNGIMGCIVLGNPLKDIVVYNHRQFNIAATRERTFNTMSKDSLDLIRNACVAENWKAANDEANKHGWQNGGEGDKHPGYDMEIIMTEDGDVEDFLRTCDYATGEISVTWNDNRGKFERNTFVSRTDNVIVQQLKAPDGGSLTCDIKLGIQGSVGDKNNRNSMNFPSGMVFTNNSNEDFLNMRVMYPNPAATGSAGYEGVTRVIPKGGSVIYSDGMLLVTDVEELLLLTRIGRYGKNAQTEWGKELIQDELSAIDYDYDTLLARQKTTHSEIYARATMDYNAPEADRAKSNEELIAMQKASGNPVPAYFERLFDAGRYHYLSSSGDLGPPDLLGIWAGDCEVGWSGYYHLDANLNLQIAGAVVGNMLETIEGYTWLNEAWVPGFKINATKLLGCRGTLGGGNTPGASSGLISALSYYYPYQYVTGEMSWLMQPCWEYYQATGDTAYLRDRLYPMMKEIGYFYEDFLQLKDANGKWIFAGSISPESQPSGVPYSLVNNSSFDIAGAKWGLETLIKICDILDDDAGGQKDVWQAILDDLPPYIINNIGALAEWSWPSLADRNAYTHRHSSGMIGVCR